MRTYIIHILQKFFIFLNKCIVLVYNMLFFAFFFWEFWISCLSLYVTIDCSLCIYFQLFVLVCRAVGLSTRLVYSLQPVSFKPTDLVRVIAVFFVLICGQSYDCQSNSLQETFSEPPTQTPDSISARRSVSNWSCQGPDFSLSAIML